MTYLVRPLVIVVSYGISIFVAVYFGMLYDYLFPFATGGSFIGDPDTWNWIIGFPIAAIFLLTLLIHIQGGKNVWWWNGIALIPAILFELAFDPLHIYLPLILGLIAWGLGVLVHRILLKLTPSFMALIS